MKNHRTLILLWIFLLGLWMVTTGCSSTKYPSDAYGYSQGPQSKNSLNGLSVFRNFVDSQRFRTYHVEKLSGRVENLDTIVWTTVDFNMPSEASSFWFNRWLAAKPNRTLVMVGRDFSAASLYWKDAADRANDTSKIEYRTEGAFVDLRHESECRQVRSTTKNDWFALETRPNRTTTKEFRGLWADELTGTSFEWSHRHVPRRLDQSEIDSMVKVDEEDETEPEEIEIKAEIDLWGNVEYVEPPVFQAFDSPPEYESLLESSDGTPLVMRIRRKDWGNSQLIVLANGAPILNYSLLRQKNTTIADLLVREWKANGRVGFLRSSSDPAIVNENDSANALKGFEMLTVWPLSLVTMHAIILGMIVLLALIPIFGRARSLPQRATRDFGHHLEALGNLLHNTQDRRYALQTISNYFRHVKNDPNSPWASVAEQLSTPMSSSATEPPKPENTPSKISQITQEDNNGLSNATNAPDLIDPSQEKQS